MGGKEGLMEQKEVLEEFLTLSIFALWPNTGLDL